MMNDAIPVRDYIAGIMHNNIDEYATFEEKEGHFGQ